MSSSDLNHTDVRTCKGTIPPNNKDHPDVENRPNIVANSYLVNPKVAHNWGKSWPKIENIEGVTVDSDKVISSKLEYVGVYESPGDVPSKVGKEAEVVP